MYTQTASRIFALLLLSFFLEPVWSSESYDVAGGSYRAMREVESPGGKGEVLVTQFMHQGLISLSRELDPREENAGKTVFVTTKAKKPVPFKILQLGPGDFCRIAIQLEDRVGAYLIYYGIPAGKSPNESMKIPPWTATAGLLFETRSLEHPFDMNSLDSLKRAYEKSRPIGADYVSAVSHGFNPFTMRREPFMSRYRGNLKLPQQGRYSIVTSSHHCSFVQIDGQTVASHPGRHHRSWNARPELVKQVTLTADKPHLFEYYHATGDDQASMVVVWEEGGSEKPKQLSLIPAEYFGSDRIVRGPTGHVLFADQPGSPDFEYRVVGSVPLPDNDRHLISVQFTNKSGGLAARGKLRWEFGDGQTSEEASPLHIYMKPGIYSVRLHSDTASQNLVAVNRIEIDQPKTVPDPKNLPTLDQYLTVLEKYDTAKMDPDSLLQLVEAFQAKIDQILNPTREQLEAEEAAMLEGTPKPNEPKAKARTAKKRKGPSTNKTELERVARYRRLIAETVRNALVNNADFKGDQSVHKLALVAGSIARDFLNDWKLAGQIYTSAAKKLTFADFAAEQFALAADVSMDMRNMTAAKNFITQAEKRCSKMGISQSVSTFYRVQADYFAETGQGAQANEALQKAGRASASRVQYAERIAQQGSASRSAEKFLQEENFDRAIESLRLWQLEHPSAVYDGYMTLLFAQYWIGREQYALAAALADRQLVINPDSSYMDELLFAAAEASKKAKKPDAARAYLHSLIKDYPGSLLIEKAKEKLESLSASP